MTFHDKFITFLTVLQRLSENKAVSYDFLYQLKNVALFNKNLVGQ